MWLGKSKYESRIFNSAPSCCVETVFDYPWKQVVQAFWNRYPNPSSTHVLTEDTIERVVREEKLYSRRIFSKVNNMPKWGECFYRNAPVKIIEDSVLDPKKKTLITYTRNIGMRKIMKVDEVVAYTEQTDGRTLAVRQAYISSSVLGFSRTIRAFGTERFKANCVKTVHGFNYVLKKMFPNHQHVNGNGNGNEAEQTYSHPNGTNTVVQSSDRVNKIKTDIHNSYGYVKSQVRKMAQIFSIEN